MATEKIDVKLITDNLVELLTNTINISSLFSKIFNTLEAAETIETEQYVYDGSAIVATTVYVDNMTKIKQEVAKASSSVVDKCVKKDEIDGETLKFDDDLGKLRVNESSIVAGTSESVINRNSLEEHVKVWVGTQVEYGNLENKDSSTLYFIKEE